MKDLVSDYLWDGSGEKDAEAVRLERALAGFRHAGREPQWPDGATLPGLGEAGTNRQHWFQFMAVAASVLILASGWFGLRVAEEPVTSTGSWDVQSVAGAPKVGANFVKGPGDTVRLRAGQWLETDGKSQASLTVTEIGKINVEPGTRLRLVESREGRTWMKLERGTIHAFIWAPAGQFMVDTPSALAVDLGCRYTLQVDDKGQGVLRTTMGWVGFKLNGREAFIPQGAVDETRPGVGPGTPFFEDADPEFLAALKRFDFEGLSEEQRKLALNVILARARNKDALTLWHLLSRAPLGERDRVFDVLNRFVPAPTGVTKDGIAREDQPMLDAWWNELGFDDISVWRTWERKEIENTSKRH